MKIGEVDVGATAKATFKEFREDDLQGLAAEVAYNILFAIVPLFLFLTALVGFIGGIVGRGEAVTNITTWLQTESGLPQATREAVLDPIIDVVTTRSGGLLSFGALLALWSGKNAVSSLMKALNVAFDVKEGRPWLKKTAIAIGLTIALGLAISASSLMFLAGSWIGDTVFGWLGLGDIWATVWALLRWPLIVVLLVVALAFLYWAGPHVNAPFTWLTPGSVLAVVLWGLATFGLGIYFSRFAGYVTAYGVLGGVLAFVFWLYVMSIVLLLGGELNAVLARRHSTETQAQLADPDKALSDTGAKRRGASGKEPTGKGGRGAERDESRERPLPPLPPLPAFQAVAADLPSTEQAARASQEAEGDAGRRRRFRSATTALGLSALAAVSGTLLGRRGG